MFELYPWQIEAVKALKDKDAILSAPTGSGKSMVAYEWAKIYHQAKDKRIFFTSPIKALSQERYVSIREMGIDVGIETGDFKENERANIVCCTQEIFTLKYINEPCYLIIDEFHYIYQNKERTRAYIDALNGLHKDSNILLISATFSNSKELIEYLNHITGRDFTLYETEQRVIKIKAKKGGVDTKDIKDSLIFAFSVRGCNQIAENISRTRKGIPKKSIDAILDHALYYNVSMTKFENYISKGVGVYYGSLLPKEKLFFTKIYKERLIDIVVGTDSLSVGVNLPAETVIFGQLCRFYDGVLTKNEFVQMSGRAGRKGYFDTGYYTYLKNSPAESHSGKSTEANFLLLLAAEYNPFNIDLGADYKKLISDKNVDQEAEYIANLSYPKKAVKPIKLELKTFLRNVEEYADNSFPNEKAKFLKLLSDCYAAELDVMENLNMAKILMKYDEISYHMMVMAIDDRRGRFYALLTLKKYINGLSSLVAGKITDAMNIDLELELIDLSVFNSSMWD